MGFPVALAVGALRYRLWELDRVVVATIVYGGLAVLIAGVYVGVVVGFAALAGDPGHAPALLPSILATALVAVLFAPVQERLSRAARRLVYGVRATPYEALAALPHRLAEAPAVDDVLPARPTRWPAAWASRAPGCGRSCAGEPRVAWSAAGPATVPSRR